MYLAHEETRKHLDAFLKTIEPNPMSWRLISIEFQECPTLNSNLFENIALKSLHTCFEQTDCKIFWFKPCFILVFFQGRALPIEKCVEDFFKATEFKGFGRFFDIMDLSIHWSGLSPLIERIQKTTSNKKELLAKQAIVRTDLPAEPMEFTIELSPEKIVQMAPSRAARKRHLILLVEDDPFTLQLVKLALKDSFEIIAAETARQALAYYQRHLPDMVFLDIQLPDGNGINLLEQISAADKEAYAVMLSSHAQKEKIMECLSLGAKGFIAKPFTRQRLVDAVTKFLNSKSMKPEPIGGRHGT
ncbi:MAG TPA: response regulator [Alphaproteobacteria bacterium]|nr:response regulator [Alphaproteobacteria bacterium]HNS45349.1 response regulator [Alphaproteobacteria bacterium]